MVSVKAVLLGDVNVGKTTLFNRFSEGQGSNCLHTRTFTSAEKGRNTKIKVRLSTTNSVPLAICQLMQDSA